MAKNSPFRECRIHNVNCEPLAGNLYGTTFLGGNTGGRECPPGCGVVFKVDLFARLGLDGYQFGPVGRNAAIGANSGKGRPVMPVHGTSRRRG
jgi:hypothetical protein